MTTKLWTGIKLVNIIKADIPWFVAPFIPYGLVINRFNSDWHISGVLHESFHAYQARVNYNRLEKAERATKWGNEYLWEDEAFKALWKRERVLLADALQEDDPRQIKKFITE